MKINGGIVTAGVAVLSSLFVIVINWYPGQLVAALLLVTILPGYALLTALWPNSSPLSGLERWLIAAAAGYGLTVSLLLLFVIGNIPLNALTISVGLSGLTIISVIAAHFQKSTPVTPITSSPKLTTTTTVIIIAIILIAAFFRLANLHYSDHQGDEADILLRAVSLLYGKTETILTHSKGPGEIMLLSAVGAMTGRFDELTARIPFSVAGAISVGLIILLAGRMFSPPVGIVAGLLATIDGVFVSYARTAQYQSGVLILTLATLLCYYCYHQNGFRERKLHILGSFLLAAAFLFHFETVLLLPVVLYLSTTAKKPLSHLFHLWPSAIIFTVITTAFYLPFLLHPNATKTGTYLENRIGGGSFPPFNNLGHFFYIEALKYNSIYYVLLFNLLLLLVAYAAVRTGYTTRITMSLISPLIAGFALYMTGWEKTSALIIALGLLLFFLLVIFSAQTTVPHRILWLWIAPPFLVYIFLVNRPGKHHYLFLAALTILVSLIIIKLWQHLPVSKPAVKWATLGVGAVLLLIFANHTVMILLRSDLEYTLTYPAHKSSFYPTDSAYPYGTRIGFGYPFRLGWQVIGHLKRTGQLEGTWAGNDGGNAPNWYMLNNPSTDCYPEYVLRGEITYKGKADFDVPFNPADFGYIPRYQIWGNDKLRMTVFQFNPAGGQAEAVKLYEPSFFDHPVTAADFAKTLSPQPAVSPQIVIEPGLVLGEGSELKKNAPPKYLERAKQLKGRVILTGYDLDNHYAYPSGIVPITLHWQAQSLLSLRYKTFIHIISPTGQLLAQADDFPLCGTSHTNSWPSGATVLDRHLIKLPPDMPPGKYSIRVGMYEPELNLRLNYFDIAGNEQGNSLSAGTLTVSDK